MPPRPPAEKPETLSPHDPEFWQKIAARLPVCEENRQLWTGAACAQLAALGFPANPLLSQSPEKDVQLFFAWIKDHFAPDLTADGEGFEA